MSDTTNTHFVVLTETTTRTYEVPLPADADAHHQTAAAVAEAQRRHAEGDPGRVGRQRLKWRWEFASVGARR